MNTSRIAAIVLGAAALSGIGLVGCGGSDGTASTEAAASTQADGANAEPRMTKAEYIAAANKVCTDTEAKGNALAAPTSASEFGPYLAKAADVAQSGIDGLSGLYPPAELQAAHDKLIAAEEKAITLTRDLAGKLDGASAEEAATLAATIETPEFQNASKDINAAAKELGLENCGEQASGTDSDSGSDTDTNDG